MSKKIKKNRVVLNVRLNVRSNVRLKAKTVKFVNRMLAV